MSTEDVRVISATTEIGASYTISLVQNKEELDVLSEIKMDKSAKKENGMRETSPSHDGVKCDLDNDSVAGIASRLRSRKRKGLCASSVLDYYISEDFEAFKLPPKKRRSVAWTARMPELVDDTIFPSNMPNNLKAKIYRMSGTNVMLVVEKSLTTTDVSDHQNRLQIPFNQMSNESHKFLTEDEKDFLDERDEKNNWNHISTPFLDLQLDAHDIKLRKWVMNKKQGEPTNVYVLNNPWIKIVRKNGLEASDVIQLWSFRIGDQLNLALAKVEEDE